MKWEERQELVAWYRNGIHLLSDSWAMYGHCAAQEHIKFYLEYQLRRLQSFTIDDHE